MDDIQDEAQGMIKKSSSKKRRFMNRIHQQASLASEAVLPLQNIFSKSTKQWNTFQSSSS